MTDSYLILEKEASHLAQQLFGDDLKKRTSFTNRLLDICIRTQGNDFLLIHNPGGWGTTRLENLLQWERSIVEGVNATIERIGYTSLLMQYFRTGNGWREKIRDIKEQIRFFAVKRKILAAELEFVTRHSNSLRVILLGVSQGAAFSNAALQSSNQLERVYSIEVGMPFLRFNSRRVVTEKTLAVSGNGLVPDAVMEWDIKTILKAFGGTFFRWVKYRLQRKPQEFSHCVNVPGHEYNWEYPEVQRQIEDFLDVNFGTKSNAEVIVS